MTRVTPGFSTSLLPETVEALRARLDATFASRPIDCTLAAGLYPFATHPLERWTGPLALRVDKNTRIDFIRHRRPPKTAANPRAPALTLAFSQPVRITKDVAATWSQTFGAKWVCGEYNVAAVSRIVLDGSGRMTLHAETGRLLAWPAAYAEHLIGASRRLFGGADAASGADAGFFAQVARTVLAHLPQKPAAQRKAAARKRLPVGNVGLSTSVQGPGRFSVTAAGDLRHVAKHHPVGRAVLEHPVFRALAPPGTQVAAAARPSDVAYRVEAATAYQAGNALLHATAKPADDRAPAWEISASFADVHDGARRWASGMATLSRVPQGRIRPRLGRAARRVPSRERRAVPVAAFVHNVPGTAQLVADAAPPAVLPGLPRGNRELPPHVEVSVLGLLENARLTGRAQLRAGAYEVGAYPSRSRLVVQADGALEMDVETKPKNARGEVRLQRASVRWSGAEPLVWRIGFTDFVLGRAVGRFLDRIFQVRVRGASVDAAGELTVDGGLYLLGWQLCGIDTLRRWAARSFPDDCPTLRAETDVASWLRGIYLWPDTPWTNDEYWRLWRNLRTMDMGLTWQLQPRQGEHLRTETGNGGRLTTAPMAGEVRMSDAGDVTVTVAALARAQGLAFNYEHGEHAFAGHWSARLSKHVFPYPADTAAGAQVPDETRLAGAVRAKLTEPYVADVRAEASWAAADPDAVQAQVAMRVELPDGPLAGKLSATARYAAPCATGAPAPVPGLPELVMEQARWTLHENWVTPTMTIAAGEGGWFTRLTANQRLRLATMRARP